MDIDNIPFEDGSHRSSPGCGRGSSFGGGGSGSRSYGQGGGSIFDASINLGDGIDFGESDHNGGFSIRKPGSDHNKSLVDIFLAEGNTGAACSFDEDYDDKNAKNKYPSELGNRTTRCFLYLCLAAVGLMLVFVSIPKLSSSIPSNEEKPPLDEQEPQNVEQGDVLMITEHGMRVDMNRPQAVYAFLLEKNISTVEELNGDTPASLAGQWMASMDPAQLDVPGYAHNKHNLGTEEEQGIYFLQRYALACLYFSMMATKPIVGGGGEGRSLQVYDHWTVGDDVCGWSGVECNDNKYVTSLDLKDAKLNGRLVPEIFQEAALPYLASLDLSGNDLQGGIPLSHIKANTKLKVLKMEDSNIKGSAVLDLIAKKLPGLVDLNLQSNDISGTLPDDWSLLSNLVTLKLSINKLTGSLPSGMSSLSKLKWIQLDGNQLTGTIPKEYAAFQHSLSSLKIADNQIGGTLPDFLGDLHLVHASLQSNRFNGKVPTMFGKMTTLLHLHLENNDLVGTMPEEVCALMAANNNKGSLQGLSADCKEPKLECSCCSKCY